MWEDQRRQLTMGSKESPLRKSLWNWKTSFSQTNSPAGLAPHLQGDTPLLATQGLRACGWIRTGLWMRAIHIFIGLVSLSQGGTGMVNLEEDQRFVIAFTFWSSKKFIESVAGVGFPSCFRASVAWFLSDKPGRTWPAVLIPILIPNHDKSKDLFFCSFFRDKVTDHICTPRSNSSCPVFVSPPCSISFTSLSSRGASAEHIFLTTHSELGAPLNYLTNTPVCFLQCTCQFASIDLCIVYWISVYFPYYSGRVQVYFVHCYTP